MAQLVLEYLKVFLSAPVMIALVAIVFFSIFREDLKALFLRIAKIRFPGGTEVSTSQSERQEFEATASRESKTLASATPPNLPGNLAPQVRQEIENLLVAEQATSRTWEYRYLNYFLVIHTQRTLDWLSRLPQPVAFSFYDSQWLPIIPSSNERGAVINALQAHHLIQVDAQSIAVTQKGYEYIQWRGAVPEPS
jgi:hypothetical protein